MDISEDRDFIEKYILKGKFPLPDGEVEETLKNKIKDCGTLIKFDMYYYVDEIILPLVLGEIVTIGGLFWRVTNRVYNYDKNEITYTLKQA
jgi:hypothetical protein